MGLAALLAAGCTAEQIYQPLDTDVINRRSTLVLEATPQAPLTDEQAKAEIGKLEAAALKSPWIGRATSRAQFQASYRQDFQLLDDYTLLSDTLSALGLWDREQTARIGKRTDSELLLSLEVFSVPCDACTDGDQVAAVGQLVDAQTGFLVWRTTLLHPADRTPQAVQAGLDDVSARLIELFNDSLRPKWHRERFKNLDAARFNKPRKTIQQLNIEAGQLFQEATKPVQGLYP